MIDWDQAAQRVAAIVAAVFRTMVAWWDLALPRLVFSPELAPVHRRIELARAIRPGHRLLVLDQTLMECQSARDALAGGGCRRCRGQRWPVVIVAAAHLAALDDTSGVLFDTA
jgi:hypothetical protein